MILIGKTANSLFRAYVIAHSAVLKAVDEFVRMREITRSVKVALKCVIAVVLVNDDFSYWTSKVEHLVAFTAIFSNICTAHAQKRLFMNFRCKFRHHRSIRRPRFPIGVQNFSDLATFTVDFLHFICWMSAIFLLPGRLTYWPRKYTTRVEPHVDNSHQVWSWYYHTLPSYSVFVCRHVTWPCNLDLRSFDLEHMSCIASHVTNTATKYEDPTPIRSWVMSYNVSRWLPLEMRMRLLRMRRITWPVSRR